MHHGKDTRPFIFSCFLGGQFDMFLVTSTDRCKSVEEERKEYQYWPIMLGKIFYFLSLVLIFFSLFIAGAATANPLPL